MRGTAIGAALLIGLGGAAEAQERPAAETGGGSWLGRLWPFGRRVEKPAEAQAVRGVTTESLQAARERELAAWQRRSAVCLRLQEIAVRTGDADLEKRADDLSRMAWDTYLMRTGQAAGGSADEELLGQQLPATSGEALLQRGASRPGGVASRRE